MSRLATVRLACVPRATLRLFQRRKVEHEEGDSASRQVDSAEHFFLANSFWNDINTVMVTTTSSPRASLKYRLGFVPCL